MNHLPNEIRLDINRIDKISAVPTILEMICRTTHMGFAAVARVTDSYWVACSVRDEIGFGLKPGGELKLETTICDEIRQSGNEVIIDHVAEDDKFCDHHTPAMYGFQSYISMPITRRDGSFFGTLCAIDPKPAQLSNPEVVNMFRLYCELIAFHLEAIEQLECTEQQLKDEQALAELREQFIAVLGHDLKAPIGAIANSARVLKTMNANETSVRITDMIVESSFRMNSLVDNILDFARGRMGGGIPLNLIEEPEAHIFLEHIISELKALRPEAIIESQLETKHPVIMDSRRISQLLSNLLGNALSYGKAGHPVIVTVLSGPDVFSLDVTNVGEKISDTAMPLLFQPFSRGKVHPDKEGLGLGLYIASEIAKAHGGELTVTSTDVHTTFSFRMPTGCTNGGQESEV